MSKLFSSSVRTTARKTQLKRTTEMRERDLEFIGIVLVIVELLCCCVYQIQRFASLLYLLNLSIGSSTFDQS